MAKVIHPGDELVRSHSCAGILSREPRDLGGRHSTVFRPASYVPEPLALAAAENVHSASRIGCPGTSFGHILIGAEDDYLISIPVSSISFI
ncbi:hypothetical protein An02g07270 [Aspergillus niger]|uniref:Uncharacterized protein n=2 Tax=Aspergillus niger TaxID=5061 RepID=A2QDJ0_ASPNC|nr:hypothetical protein An02g07270 [Aspergillus niger]CAK37691.1 hypothetical protein An02g07270 [Aspergillus niger]